MSEPTIPEFLSSLEQSQLLTDAQFQRLKKQLVGNPLTAEGLANVLVGQEHLTQWQAKQLLKGQSGIALKHYRLLNPIGRGGMGHVFRGRNTQTNDVIAVKVMARKLTRNKTLVSRFRREIRASSLLDSPHIVRTLDAGQVGKIDFMIMEYVNGDQVDRIATRLGRVPVGMACDIIRQVATGLQHAHERKMVHRDIKPGNMVVHWEDSGAGIVKLMDMGLVLLMADDADEQTVTRAGQVMGTPDYMSPEQGWDTSQVDIRSDIYSLGCTFFRLLTGQIPFHGTNPLQVLSQRLQRDAPSVLTICDDIPPAVAEVVSKMTARKTDERYQTPAEVVTAIEPLCEPLNRQALRAAAQAATNDADVDFSEPAGDEHEIDESDHMYKQFLQAVDDGSVVDLMLATDVGDSVETEISPLPDIRISTPPATAHHGRPQRGQKAGYWVIGIGTVVLAIVVALVLTQDGGNTDVPPEPASTDLKPNAAQIVKASFLDSTVDAAKTGELWTYHPKTDVAGVEGEVRIEIGGSAPSGVTMNADTGVLAWQVPAGQTVGPYTIRLTLVHAVDGQDTVIAETEINMTVGIGLAAIKLPKLKTAELAPEQQHRLSFAVAREIASAFELQYRLEGTNPEGMKIGQASGEFQWKPALSDVGRHNVKIAVFEKGDAEPRDVTTLAVIVVPTDIRHVLPEIPRQTATAGQVFQLQLPGIATLNDPRGQGVRVIESGPGTPSGFSISRADGMIRWNVPDDASGLVKVALSAKLESLPSGRSRNLTGIVLLEIDITSPTSQPGNKLPPDEEVSAALAELRKTYEKQLIQARTTILRVQLATLLLEQCYASKPGATDVALMQLIDTDLAEKARASDIQLETARLRALRYQTDEFEAAETIFKAFRRTGLSSQQQDAVIEHGLRLGLAATRAEHFELADTILGSLKLLVRSTNAQGAAVRLAKDIADAAKLALELTRESAETTISIKAGQLAALLGRWQFQGVFVQPSGLTYIQAAAAGAAPSADNGRELWNIEGGTVQLTTSTQQGAIAFLDPSQQVDRFVIRFDLLPTSNAAHFVFGATGTGATEFKAFSVVLNPSAMGQIQDFRSATAFNESVNSALSLSTSHANAVEVMVDGPRVVVRINGTLVSQAQVPALTAGRLGLAADLRRADPQLSVRRVRILVLPNE
ncbi:MAG: protein kinase [Fuerstiella sp.]